MVSRQKTWRRLWRCWWDSVPVRGVRQDHRRNDRRCDDHHAREDSALDDSQVAGLKIDVDTTLGVVTMSGVVRSRNEEQRAVQLARGVPGVKDVRSTLQVTPSQP